MFASRQFYLPQQQIPSFPYRLPLASSSEAMLNTTDPIVEPGPGDVLFGRGVPIQSSPGNQAFHKMTDEYKQEYQFADNARKSAIVRTIISRVRDGQGGRFLKPFKRDNKGDVLFWYEADDREVRKKIMQTVRTRLSRDISNAKQTGVCPDKSIIHGAKKQDSVPTVILIPRIVSPSTDMHTSGQNSGVDERTPVEKPKHSQPMNRQAKLMARARADFGDFSAKKSQRKTRTPPKLLAPQAHQLNPGPALSAYTPPVATSPLCSLAAPRVSSSFFNLAEEESMLRARLEAIQHARLQAATLFAHR